MGSFDLVKMQNGKLRGVTVADDETFRKHQDKVANLEPGEIYSVAVKFPRDSVRHRRFMALMRFLFEHWGEVQKPRKYKGVEVELDFEAFRRDMVILAGFAKATYEMGPRGGTRVRLEPESISFARMDNERFESLYAALINLGIKHFLPKSYETPDHVREILEKIERHANQ